MRQSKDVLKEIRRRAKAGRSLKSGDNRGDWLYAAAVKFLGSWGAAVEEAGFAYDEINTRPLTAEEVVDQIQELASSGERLVVPRRVRNLGRHRSSVIPHRAKFHLELPTGPWVDTYPRMLAPAKLRGTFVRGKNRLEAASPPRTNGRAMPGPVYQAALR